MSKRMRDLFEEARRTGRKLFIPYVTAGFPRLEDTVPILLAAQEGGADVIEIGMPFTDPLADGATSQTPSPETSQTSTVTAVVRDAEGVAICRAYLTQSLHMGFRVEKWRRCLAVTHAAIARSQVGARATFGQLVQQRRIAAGMSGPELAQRAGLDRKTVLNNQPKYFCPQHKFVYKSRHTFRQHVHSHHKDDPNFNLPEKFDFYLVKRSAEGEEIAKQTSKTLEEKNSEEEEVSSDDLVDVTEDDDDDDDDDNGSCDSNSGDALHKLPSSKHEGSLVPVAFSEEDSFLGRIESGVNASVELFCRLRGAEMCRKVERSFLNDSYRFAVCNVVANNLAEQFSAENIHEKTAIADPAQLQSACFTSTTIDSLLAFHKKFLATQQSISSNMEKLKEYQRAINENIGKWHVKQAALQYASSTSKKRKFDE